MMAEHEVTEAGYAYIYVSNENPTHVELYFDDISVTYTPTNIIQSNEYYPFGMQTAKSWTRQGNENKYLYNAGNELNEESGLYETFYRGYDATLGKFLQVDPLADKYGSLNPYQYALNNPVLNNDPMGDEFRAPSGYSRGIGRVSGGKKFGNGNGYQDYHAGSGAMYGSLMEYSYSSRMGGLPAYMIIAKNAEKVKNGEMSHEDYARKYGESDLSQIPGMEFKDNYFVTSSGATEHYFSVKMAGKFLGVMSGGEYQSVFNKNSAQNGGQDPNALDPSTLNQNLFNQHYPGGDNPRTYAGDPDYSTRPVNISGYPAIGHDRRYDNLGTAGLKGLLTDTRAIGADWQFVLEELAASQIAIQNGDILTGLKARALGIGLGAFAYPKTLFKLLSPGGAADIATWYQISNQGVTNLPSKGN